MCAVCVHTEEGVSWIAGRPLATDLGRREPQPACLESSEAQVAPRASAKQARSAGEEYAPTCATARRLGFHRRARKNVFPPVSGVAPKGTETPARIQKKSPILAGTDDAR